MVDQAWRRKFGLDRAQRLLVVSPEAAGLARLRGQLDSDQRLDHEAEPAVKYPLLFFWPTSVPRLAAEFARLSHVIQADGAIWVIFPKKEFAETSGVELTWEEMQAAALTTDLVDNKVASFSDTHYGTRFVLRKEVRHRYLPQ